MQTRRHFLKSLTATAVAGDLPLRASAPPLKLNYLLASALYGDMTLEVILPEVSVAGSAGLDVWCKPHGTQREQAEAMGLDAFAELLKRHAVKPICFTQYPLGPFGLQKEFPVLRKLGGTLMVCGSGGPKNLAGAEARDAIKAFLEKMKPHADAAAEHGITLAIENHATSLLSSPDSIRAWAEFNRHPALGVAFAPHHLSGGIDDMPGLIRDLGSKNLPFIYLQEHGVGSQKKVEKKIELQQLPGLGTLDYKPILRALREVQFSGWVDIFMHPTPRGVPILPSAKAITEVLGKSRAHIERIVAEVNA